jgi:DNA-binding HxlR family transcriptional regulator
MKRTSLSHHPCSIARTLDVVGEWWTPLILRDVAYGISRFNDLQADLGISANVLADRLETLVAEGLLATRVYETRPRRHEYVLTEKGIDLVPALIALMQWGDRWAWPDGRGPVRVLHDCGSEVRVEARCTHCEREVAPTELRVRPRGRVADAPREGEPGHLAARRVTAARDGARLAQPNVNA